MLEAYLIESALILQNNVTLFMRGEHVQEGELTHDLISLYSKNPASFMVFGRLKML